MAKQITVTLDDWLFELIERQKEERKIGRSELVQELVVKGIGLMPPQTPKAAPKGKKSE